MILELLDRTIFLRKTFSHAQFDCYAMASGADSKVYVLGLPTFVATYQGPEPDIADVTSGIGAFLLRHKIDGEEVPLPVSKAEHTALLGFDYEAQGGRLFSVMV